MAGRCHGCAAIAGVLALLAGTLIAFLERPSSGDVSYLSDSWAHECAKWDPDAGRFLVSTGCATGVAEVAASGDAEEKVVVADLEAAGKMAAGIAIDRPRRRLLVVYAEGPMRSGFSAVGAYKLGSWKRDEPAFANDVAVDEDGTAYVADTHGNKVWKVGLDGKLLKAIRSDIFFHRKGWLDNLIGLNGIVYHPNGYLLAVHTSGGDLFKIDIRTEDVSVVKVRGSLKRGDGLALLSPTRLVIAGTPTHLAESSDDWETANVTGRYIGPMHRLGTTATVKDGDVYINHMFGFGLGKKKFVIAKAVFSPLKVSV